VQKPPQPPVTGRIMRRLHRLLVLAEELTALPLRQVPENDLRVIRILDLNRLSGHTANLQRGPDADPRQQGRVTRGR
jgi:hypothetical protein